MVTALYICYFSTEEPLVHTQVLPYLRAVAHAGVRMHLLTYEKRGAWREGERARRRELKQRLAADGIEWHTLRYHKRPSLVATGYDVLLGFLYCAWLIARHRVGIIHARAHVPAVIGLAVKAALRRKLIFDFRGLMAEEYVDNGVWPEGSLPFRLVKSVERSAAKRADRIIVLTQKLKAILTSAGSQQIDGSKISVIPCCVDLSGYDTQSEREKSPDRLTLVYAGSATGRYLLSEMIDFFKALRRKVSDARFLVITKSDKQQLRRIFGSKNVDDGSYSIISATPDQMPALLSGADIGISFIKPSVALTGASPTKIGEYLAAGLPVVSTPDVGDLDDLLQSNDVGVIVNELNTNDYDHAVDQVLDILSSAGARGRCRRVTAETYSLSEIGEPRYITVYHSLNGSVEGSR